MSAPVRETVSADAPPPWADAPNAPAAAGLEGRNGARGELGSGPEVSGAGRRAGVVRWRACVRLVWATTARVKTRDRDSSRTSVRFRTTRCLRTNDGCLAGGPVCGVPTACEELSSTWLEAGEVIGTTPVRGTTPASSRCTSTVGGGGIDGIVKTGNGGRTAGIEGGTGGGGSAGCATGCDVAAAPEAEALEAALAAARFDWVTSPSFPGLAIRIDTATLHCTQTEGTTAGAGAPPGQSHCQFQIQIVDPAGGAGTDGAELGSQFQLQFQIQTSGGVVGDVFTGSGVMSDELSPAVLPPVSAAAGPDDGGSGDGAVDPGAAGAGPVPVGAPCTTAFWSGGATVSVEAGGADGEGSAVGAPADTTGGITNETVLGGTFGVAGATGSGTLGAATTTVGTGGAGGTGTTTTGSVGAGGRTGGAATPSAANADGATAATSANATTTTVAHLATHPSRRARWSI